MPRIRTVKPEMWTDGKVVRLSDSCNLLFIALLNQADDAGRLKNDPKEIECRAPRFWERSSQLIQELELIGLITAYGDNREYLQIVNFSKHQRIDKPSQSSIPPIPRTFQEHSKNILAGKERKGKERKDLSAGADGVVSLPASLSQNPVHRLVRAWKKMLEIPKEDKSWDKAHFARCSKSSKLLLEIFGGENDEALIRAADCMADVYYQLQKSSLECTLETVVKRAHEWRKEHEPVES